MRILAGNLKAKNMLANLDNEVYFKKVFTDVEVFTAFVKDVLGIEIHIDKVETEKVLPGKISAIKFKMDLFAEDKQSRTVVEIQKVDYDYTYDRFTHYFLGNLIDMQRASKTYAFAKEVYIIVVVTSAYRISDKNGKPIKDDVLITDVNPRTLQGEIRDMYNHKMVILNTTHVDAQTPPEIGDWLDLIIQSMKNPEHPQINARKPAILRAAQLAEVDNLSPEQLAEAKEQEQRKEAVAVIEDITRKQTAIETEKKVKDEGIKKSLNLGILTHEQIAATFDVNLEHVRAIAETLKNR
ncbi:MAG: hypothetical protein SF052_25370 [Bacteroidia bacterium]|nr:hypothetical protein [Bacteroidia bacterium]